MMTVLQSMINETGVSERPDIKKIKNELASDNTAQLIVKNAHKPRTNAGDNFKNVNL